MFPDYVLDDTLDDDAPDDDNGINDNNDDENYNYYNNENNGGDQLNDNNDDENANNYDNDNDGQAIMIFQTIYFLFTHVYVNRQILVCLHSVNPCLIYSKVETFEKLQNEEAQDYYVKMGRNPYR